MKCFLEFLNNNDGIIAFFVLIASLISAIAAGIIAFATWRYTNYSRKNYEELKKQNEFLKEKSEEEYILGRKKVVLDLLHEININEVTATIILEQINSIFRALINEKDKDKIISLANKNLPNLINIRDSFGHLNDEPYKEFSKYNISFKINKVSSKIEEYFNPILVMPFVNIDLFRTYLSSPVIDSDELIRKIVTVKRSIEIVLKTTTEIYDVIKEDLGIDYRLLPEYIPS